MIELKLIFCQLIKASYQTTKWKSFKLKKKKKGLELIIKGNAVPASLFDFLWNWTIYIFKYITYIMPEEGNEFSAAPKVVRPKKKYKEKEP